MEVLFGQSPLNTCTQYYNQRLLPNGIFKCEINLLGACPQTEPYHFHFYSDAPSGTCFSGYVGAVTCYLYTESCAGCVFKRSSCQLYNNVFHRVAP